ncbi:hypothetical protein IMZ48_46745 [Candidatus Bathyarchaeota archaeon]|nr:hypothetical protein [Candidatus Bathyarchaeota archaeon]
MLAKFVGGNVSNLDIAERRGVSETNFHAELNLTNTFNITYPVLTGKSQDETAMKPFYADYAGYDSRRPFINPPQLARWTWAANYLLDEALKIKIIFMDWFNK